MHTRGIDWVALVKPQLDSSTVRQGSHGMKDVAEPDRVPLAVLLLQLATSSGGALDDWA